MQLLQSFLDENYFDNIALFEYRILYLYPDILTLKQLEEFATLEKFIPYFDIPLQHISPKLLKSMGRFYDDKMIHTLLK
jgi:ribosomal protein S12 methylthiotransferase